MNRPVAPPNICIHEGCAVSCPKCHSSMLRKPWWAFWKERECINEPACSDYYGGDYEPAVVTKQMRDGRWLAYDNNLGYPEVYGETEEKAENKLRKMVCKARERR